MIILAVCSWNMALPQCQRFNILSETLLLVYEPFLVFIHCSMSFLFTELIVFIYARSVICNCNSVSSIQAYNCCCVICFFDFLQKGMVIFFFRISFFSCFVFTLSCYYPRRFLAILQKCLSYVISYAFPFAYFSTVCAMLLVLYQSKFFIF